MGELSVKLKIADREYPMRVKSDEEARVRKAGKLINDKLRTYREQFGIDDKQDLLAMVAFDFLMEKLNSEAVHTQVDQGAMDQLQHISDSIAQALK